jgi:hypothetical protein
VTHQPVRIEVPDETHAAGLRRRLQPFDVETVAVDGRIEVRIELLDLNPERRVVDVLNAIDSWLPTAGLAFVRVHLDGSTYTLHAPPPSLV